MAIDARATIDASQITTPMKHSDKFSSAAAALSALATLACCLPVSFVAATAAASLSAVVSPLRPWLLGLSAALLAVAFAQIRLSRRACKPRSAASAIFFWAALAVVVSVAFFPQFVAGVIADWLPDGGM